MKQFIRYALFLLLLAAILWPIDEPREGLDIDALNREVVYTIYTDQSYNGLYSSFNWMGTDTYGIRIYQHTRFPGMVYVMFEQSVDDHFLALSLREGSRGFTGGGLIQAQAKGEMRDRLAGLEYTYLQRSEISLQPKWPVYLALDTGDREQIASDIEAAIADEMRSRDQTGLYDLYIRNFNESDCRTYAVVESEWDRDRWVYDVYLEDDWHIRLGNITAVNETVPEYKADQIKLGSLPVREIVLNPIKSYTCYQMDKNEDGSYTVRYFDTDKHTVCSQTYAQKPEIDTVSFHVYSVTMGADPCRQTVFYNELNGCFSPAYTNVLTYQYDKVAYMKDNRTLAVSNLFDAGLFYQEIERDFCPCLLPSRCIISANIDDENQLFLRYLTEALGEWTEESIGLHSSVAPDLSFLHIPAGAAVSLRIGDTALPVSDALARKIRSLLQSVDSDHIQYASFFTEAITLTVSSPGCKTVLYLNFDFRCVSTGDGLWYNLPALDRSILVERAEHNGKAYFDTTDTVVLWEERCDMDLDGRPDHLRLTYDGIQWALSVNQSRYVFQDEMLGTEIFYYAGAAGTYNPYPRAALVTLEDTGQPAVVTYFEYHGDCGPMYDLFSNTHILMHDGGTVNTAWTPELYDPFDDEHNMGMAVDTRVESGKVWVSVPSVGYTCMLPPEKYQWDCSDFEQKTAYDAFIAWASDQGPDRPDLFFILVDGFAGTADTDGDGMPELCTGGGLFCYDLEYPYDYIASCDLQFDFTSGGPVLSGCVITPVDYD
jgi:hypothetical protein